MAFTFGPNDRIWYVEKDTGEIRVLNRRTGRSQRFFLVSRVNGEGERGLLGIALDPDFPATPYVYVYATRNVDGRLRNQILRIRDAGGRGRDLQPIFSSPASGSPYHNGGRILFGPDDMLYAIVGEGHDPSNAQQLGNDQGKILRMTATGAIPDDNPLGHRRIFAYGIRNSFGFDFDPRTGDLWETENGPACNDELNRIRPGENYGWGPSQTCSGSAPAEHQQRRSRSRPSAPVVHDRRSRRRAWHSAAAASSGAAAMGPSISGRSTPARSGAWIWMPTETTFAESGSSSITATGCCPSKATSTAPCTSAIGGRSIDSDAAE